ncbi:hypothetical protein ACMD2_21586 [Ananas comosus]|uniref:Uncharacterized protein n=1 Tax=Ananas comosus TaxID=4615 RepID=A0A199V415_ANACO|nr:hypothetical protein ACMD2_21586 [Ananas comosus]
MGPRRQTLVFGFLLALLLGVVVYLRIWSIDDDDFSADDREILRRQFERANLEAMDESAEWRMKYDGEVERSRQLQDELLKVKASLASSTRRFSMLQEDNSSLRKQVVSLKQQVEAKDQICNCNQSQIHRR